jgi:hypothetical protein
MTGLGNTPDVSPHIDIGPRPDFAAWSERLGTPPLQERAARLAAARAAATR